VDKAVALISEPDWAMRELMKRALRDAGFETLDSGSFVEFDLKLRSRSLRTASCALLVLADVLSSRSQPAISALAELRAADELLEPQVMLTREFGSDQQEPPRDLGGCTIAAVLDKPFDLALFQAIAYRYRTSSAPSEGAGAHQ
jgi:CheY-like chemotaxis protein